MKTHFWHSGALVVITLLMSMFSQPGRTENVTVLPFASVSLRYENDTALTVASARERLRATVRAGIQGTLNDAWRYRVRFSTGMKNQQNVPAITIYRFTEQDLPDNDVYIDQAFVEYRRQKTTLVAGKIPWQLANSTDVFWDRDLNPFGMALHHQVSDEVKLTAFWGAPLDGAADTVGSMQAVQAVFSQQTDTLNWTFAPWLVNYEGQPHCRYACRDTDIDHTSLRLSTWVSWQQWRLALDAGYALTPQRGMAESDEDDRHSVALELRYGSIRQSGNLEVYLRGLHVEQHAVIEEFAQNATGRLAPANFQGLDARARYAIHSDWWIGARFSHLQQLEGDDKHANRFRVETHYRW